MSLLHRIGAVCFAASTTMLGASTALLTTAAPAAADLLPPADGYYTYSEAGQPPAKWEVTSVCSQASGTRAQPDYSDPDIQTLGCVVNVASSTLANLTHDEELLNFSGRARIADDLWTFTDLRPDGQVCADGRTAQLTQNFSFNEGTLSGTRTALWNSECGDAPGMTKVPFTLSFVGPMNPPVVERFPMNCDYLAGRPSICS